MLPTPDLRRATYLDVPDDVSEFSNNKGFESVGQFAVPEALAGQYLVIAERFLDFLVARLLRHVEHLVRRRS